MKKKIFDREFFVETGRKGGFIGGKKLKEKFPHEHFVRIGKLGGRPKKQYDILSA